MARSPLVALGGDESLGIDLANTLFAAGLEEAVVEAASDQDDDDDEGEGECDTDCDDDGEPLPPCPPPPVVVLDSPRSSLRLSLNFSSRRRRSSASLFRPEPGDSEPVRRICSFATTLALESSPQKATDLPSCGTLLLDQLYIGAVATRRKEASLGTFEERAHFVGLSVSSFVVCCPRNCRWLDLT